MLLIMTLLPLQRRRLKLGKVVYYKMLAFRFGVMVALVAYYRRYIRSGITINCS